MAKLGASYVAVAGDVAEKATADAAIAAAMDTFGRIDCMINNAGIGSYDAFTAYSVEDYDRIMNTNMRSTFLFTSGVVPIMKKQGSGLILQVSSQAGIRGFTREAIYCATKHAQVGFTNALRIELQPFGIKVAVVCPAGVKTEFAIGNGRTPEFVANSGFLEADDVAEAILFAAMQGAERAHDADQPDRSRRSALKRFGGGRSNDDAPAATGRFASSSGSADRRRTRPSRRR